MCVHLCKLAIAVMGVATVDCHRLWSVPTRYDWLEWFPLTVLSHKSNTLMTWHLQDKLKRLLILLI